MIRTMMAGLTAAAALGTLGLSQTTSTRPVGGIDGVWIGSLETSADGSRYQYPVLFNLATTKNTGGGVALLPDEFAGNPEQLGFEGLRDVQLRGKRVTITVVRETERGLFHLSFKLRQKRGELRGKLATDDPTFKGGRVTLRPLDGDQPLQHLWTALDRSSPLALLILGGKRPSGIGLLGGNFGVLRELVLVGNRVTGVFRGADDDINIDLTLNKKGLLAGSLPTSDERAVADVTLLPGNTNAPPRITRLGPAELKAGVFNEVAIRGRDLAPGFVFDTSRDDVSANAPAVDSTGRGAVSVFVNDDVPSGTPVDFDLLAADGSIDLGVARLITVGQAPVDYRTEIQPIFDTTCALSGCHVTPELGNPLYPDGKAAGDLILETSNSYPNLLNQAAAEAPSFQRVVPGDPELSYLIKKLRGDDDLVGNRMPAGGPPFLSEEVIAMFIRWVEEGAIR